MRAILNGTMRPILRPFLIPSTRASYNEGFTHLKRECHLRKDRACHRPFLLLLFFLPLALADRRQYQPFASVVGLYCLYRRSLLAIPANAS